MMLDKELFFKLMLIVKDLYEAVRKIESALDVELHSGPGKPLDDLMDLLANKTHFNLEELDIDPPVFTFVFRDNFGEIPRTYDIDDKEFVVDNLESLYVYLSTKFLYDKTNTEEED